MEDLDRTDWRGYCQGDNKAFTRLYHRHKNHLLTYLLQTGHSREAGEDVVQEAFLGLAKQKAASRQLDSVKNWLFICARNLGLNQLKTKHRQTALMADVPSAPSASDSDLDIQKILARLEPDESELILLREYHGFSTGELGAMFGLTEEAIRVRLYRVRKRLCELGKDCR